LQKPRIKIWSKGEIVVAQTRDFGRVAAILEAAGMTAHGLALPAACCLMAYLGTEPAGVVGIETKIDAALIRSLAVAEPIRGRGVGAALVDAARAAAHTRGARRLYALARGSADKYFVRIGFAPVALNELLDALAGTFMADHVRTHPGELSDCRALCMDISRDGVIER
jgi:N-acetylglutamate synthase-like GNAT family acetyltransferase